MPILVNFDDLGLTKPTKYELQYLLSVVLSSYEYKISRILHSDFQHMSQKWFSNLKGTRLSETFSYIMW